MLCGEAGGVSLFVGRGWYTAGPGSTGAEAPIFWGDRNAALKRRSSTSPRAAEQFSSRAIPNRRVLTEPAPSTGLSVGSELAQGRVRPTFLPRFVERPEEYPYSSAAGGIRLDPVPQGLKPQPFGEIVTRR